MTEVIVETNNGVPVPPPAEWKDVVEASAKAQAPDEETATVEDELMVKLSANEIVVMAKENEERLNQRKALEARLDREKETVKATKGEIDVLARQIDECTEAMGSGITPVTKEWKVVTIFATNTERWIDPDTGVIVKENAIPSDRRQVALPFADAVEGQAKPSVAPTLDSTTNLSGDPDEYQPDDDVEIDATEVLEAAASITDPSVSSPPTKPTRRGRKASS